MPLLDRSVYNVACVVFCVFVLVLVPVLAVVLGLVFIVVFLEFDTLVLVAGWYDLSVVLYIPWVVLLGHGWIVTAGVSDLFAPAG
jgi:hypothetical protein